MLPFHPAVLLNSENPLVGITKPTAGPIGRRNPLYASQRALQSSSKCPFAQLVAVTGAQSTELVPSV